MTRELTCIGCPMGCLITVEMEGKDIKDIKGYTCRRGLTYAQNEVTNPKRTVTSSVKVKGNPTMRMVSVKTEQDIPKEKINEALDSLKGIEITSPVKIGDIIVENVANTGVNIIATKNA